MTYIFDEESHVVVQIPFIHIENGEVKEVAEELVAGRDGRVVKGRYATVADAFQHALQSLAKALDETEAFLDKLEYRLEMEEKVQPGEIYTASYMAHALYYAATHLRQLGAELLKRRLVPHRQYLFSKTLYRRSLIVRRYARDVRLLYATVVQLSLDASMKKLTWLGTVALPALVVTSFYGMNLEWLPLADQPPVVFAFLLLLTRGFAALLNKI